MEIYNDGNVYNYNCCPNYFQWTTIGNIYKNSIEEIWNSNKSRLIRRKILKKNFSAENVAIYNANANQTIKELEHVDTSAEMNEIMPLPKLVKFSHDKECNVRCVTCRKNIILNTKEEMDLLDEKIDKYYIPLLKNADAVCMNGSGDTLASRHGRKLIKRIAETYPNIKFDLHTNGLLCTEQLLAELGIIDRLSVIEVSLHATTKETYDKFVLGSNWNKVIRNIEYLSRLKRGGKLDELLMLFVVTNFNYREMSDFIQFAKNYGAKACFWTYKNWGQQNPEQEKIFSVFDKNHKEYEELKKILHGDIFTDKTVYLNRILSALTV
jgi:MoaA/NifB/PqqE/SkfB family radical SAM enzyme